MKLGSEIKSERGIILEWSITSNGTSKTISVLSILSTFGWWHCDLCKSEIPYNNVHPLFFRDIIVLLFDLNIP